MCGSRPHELAIPAFCRIASVLRPIGFVSWKLKDAQRGKSLHGKQLSIFESDLIGFVRCARESRLRNGQTVGQKLASKKRNV